MISAPVSTIAIGMAASMGTILLTAGTKGKRYALPHSTIHLHQPLGGVQGQAADIEIEAQRDPAHARSAESHSARADHR